MGEHRQKQPCQQSRSGLAESCRRHHERLALGFGRDERSAAPRKGLGLNRIIKLLNHLFSHLGLFLSPSHLSHLTCIFHEQLLSTIITSRHTHCLDQPPSSRCTPKWAPLFFFILHYCRLGRTIFLDFPGFCPLSFRTSSCVFTSFLLLSIPSSFRCALSPLDFPTS